MSSRRVGQGRVYVKMADGPIDELLFPEWCKRLGNGQSYVSDGFAHALKFEVNGTSPGTEDVHLNKPGNVNVSFAVGFAPQTPKAVAHGTLANNDGRREVGDTRILHAPRNDEWVAGGQRQVEIIVNGEVAATTNVEPGKLREMTLEIPVEKSSWIALRQFPQLHTNPVNVIVAGKPIRASKDSAEWCAQSVELLWKNRNHLISKDERDDARGAYDHAVEIYRRRAAEAKQ
jgi:hypothetical protein